MATRRETTQRRHSLVQELRELTSRRKSIPGEQLPSTRELADRHRLSLPTVYEEIKPFIDSGAIVSVSGVGMFVGKLVPNYDHFLFVYPAEMDNDHVVYQQHSLLAGFEERASELGASTTSVADVELPNVDKSVLSLVSGVFCWSLSTRVNWRKLALQELPFVAGAYQPSGNAAVVPSSDTIAFDDYGGGRQAALHLTQLGHSRIAFLGIHTADAKHGPRWAKDRERGWEETMRERCPEVPIVSVVPDSTSGGGPGSGLRAARVLLPRLHEFTAVVGVDDHALVGLVQALVEAGVPTGEWPEMVGFEGIPELSKYSVTSLRTPWREAGEVAAQVLWERISGRLIGDPTERSVEFKLISRVALHGESLSSHGGARLIHT